MTTSIWDRRVMPGCLGAVLAALGVLQLFAAPALSAEYVLGPQDKIRLKVVEWRAGKAEYYEWTPFGGEYTVNPAGRVSFPMIGEITAEGRTSDQLARAITAELYKRTGLMGAQEAAVEIVQYRPFYVLGDVDRPGEFAFRPSLSVLQAVGVAGGLQRLSETGKRDQITAGGEPGGCASGTAADLHPSRPARSRTCRTEDDHTPARACQRGRRKPAGGGGNDPDNAARRVAVAAHGLVGTTVAV